MSFKIASKFQVAAQTINSIPVEKFPLILNRILQKLHLKSVQFFTEAEQDQLKGMLEFSAADLKTTLDACSYIYEQAAFSSTGPEPLYEILLEAGFDEAHAKVLGRLWASEAAEYIARLKAAQTMGFSSSSSLTHTDYHLNMVLGQSALSKQQEPTALFEFTIREPSQAAAVDQVATSTGKVMSSAAADKLCVEFNHEELFSFFTQLECMQQQLDALGSTG